MDVSLLKNFQYLQQSMQRILVLSASASLSVSGPTSDSTDASTTAASSVYTGISSSTYTNSASTETLTGTHPHAYSEHLG